MVTLFYHLNQEQANTFSLVLSSSGIGNRVISAKHAFRIEVPEAHVDAARKVILRYQAENPVSQDDPTVSPIPPRPNNLSGVAVALVLLCVHMAVFASAAPEDYLSVFGAHARRIVNGEVYRCATALLLHADAAHIAGNMVGMALFGGAVCAATGSGVGWLMILACGILGNLINAFAHETGHFSVGASTAVFGAVGILCAFQALNAARTGKGWKHVVLSLGGGVALLAFLGSSARSDLGAHLFGFLSGVVMGGSCRLWMGNPPGIKGQVLCGFIAASTLLMSWIRGMLS